MFALRVAALAAGISGMFAGAAHADIYTWRDASGSKRMSNVAPSWYSTTERSRIRTQVLVNGQLVDDTGLPQERRQQLQAGRARAESIGRPGALPPVAAPAAPPPPPVAATSPTGRTPPAAPPVGPIDAAKSAEGLKRALEAQKLTDSVADQLKSASRPRQ